MNSICTNIQAPQCAAALSSAEVKQIGFGVSSCYLFVPRNILPANRGHASMRCVQFLRVQPGPRGAVHQKDVPVIDRQRGSLEEMQVCRALQALTAGDPIIDSPLGRYSQVAASSRGIEFGPQSLGRYLTFPWVAVTPLKCCACTGLPADWPWVRCRLAK